MGWIWLLCASVFEVAFTTMFRLSDNFRNLGAVAALVVCIGLSLFFLELAERSIPLGTAYAVWTSIGAAGTVLIGIIFYREPATPVRVLLILGIVACAIGLNITGAAES